MLRNVSPWVLLLVALTPSISWAEVEVTPFLGYQAGGTFESRSGDRNIESSPNFGLVLSIRTRHDGLIEFLYSRQQTRLENLDIFGVDEGLDLNVEYLHFGGLWEIQQGRTRPFIGLSLGGTRFDLGLEGVSDEIYFSAGISGGAKFMFSDRVGLRVEGRGLATLLGSGGEIFCGFPPGACAITVTGSTLLQIDALVGLIVRF
jgi:hypothetical protein